MITLDTILASLHSIAIKDSTNGYELSIDSNGKITAKIEAEDLDIRNLASSQDNVEIKTAAGQALAINSDGSLNVQAVTGGYANWKVSAPSVTNTESELVSTPLTGRVKVEIQNLGDKDVYLKEVTGVSSSNGLVLAKGSSYESELDANCNIFAITASGTTSLRVVEYAA